MMVTVPRIAAVSYLDTLPFLYGIRHAADLRAELLLSDFESSVHCFAQGRADIALVPVHAVPSLDGARIVTGYCVAWPSAAHAEALAALDAEAPMLPLVLGDEAPLAPLLAPKRTKKAFACAVWVAREDADPAPVELLQHALTQGLEQTYEAVAEQGFGPREAAVYDYLTRIDYIFDDQKHKALEKFWRAGLKSALRANPG